MANDPDCAVTVRFFTDLPGFTEESIQARLSMIMNLTDAVADELSIVFVDDLQMSEYNKSYRNKEGTTDVLAFPYNEITEEGSFNLGDIVISVDTAKAQAEQMGHPLGAELDVLMIHALLHLLGYDHEKDRGEMEKKQQDILNLLHDEVSREY